MISLFNRKPRKRPESFTLASQPGLTTPQTATSLLATPYRQKLLEQIWRRTAVSRVQFDRLYLNPISRYAELVQLLPASENHHHAYPGGMLDHGLKVITYALKIRQSHLLPSGAQPEAQIAQAEAWTAALAFAALGHLLGTIVVEAHIEYADGSVWHPWHGPLARPYRFRFRRDLGNRLHGAAAGLLVPQLLNREILDWLCTFPELWASLVFYWAGQLEYAGELGTLITQAGHASVAQASGVETCDSRLNLSGALPSSPEIFYPVPTVDVIHPVETAVDETAMPSGEHFLTWLIEGLRSERIVMNTPQALVHVAEDTLFLVTPGIFRRYAQEHPELDEIAKNNRELGWEWIQKRFGVMKLHRKSECNLNIWTYELRVGNKKRRLHGYLLKNHYGLVNDMVLNNPNLTQAEPNNLNGLAQH